MDLVRAMEKDTGLTLSQLKVDGGASRDLFLMQFQADMLDMSICRPVIRETTALGAAYLAGLATGVWENTSQIRSSWASDLVLTPSMDPARRQQLAAGWRKAVGRSLAWAEE